MPRATIYYKPLVVNIPACHLVGVEDDDVEDAVIEYTACYPAVVDRVELEIDRTENCSNVIPITKETSNAS